MFIYQRGIPSRWCSLIFHRKLWLSASSQPSPSAQLGPWPLPLAHLPEQHRPVTGRCKCPEELHLADETAMKENHEKIETSWNDHWWMVKVHYIYIYIYVSCKLHGIILVKLTQMQGCITYMDGMDCHGVWIFLIHDPIIIPERTRLVSSTHVDRLMLSQVCFITFSPAHLLQTLESFRVCCNCQILSLLQNLVRITTHGTMILQYLGTWTPGNSTTPSAIGKSWKSPWTPPHWNQPQPNDLSQRHPNGFHDKISWGPIRFGPEIVASLRQNRCDLAPTRFHKSMIDAMVNAMVVSSQ